MIAFVLLVSACGGDGTDAALDTAVVGSGNSGQALNGDALNGNAPNGDDPNDNDQDGVTDGDNCPGVFNPDQADDNENGLGNSCDDAPLPDSPCGFGGSLTTEASGSGDTSVTTICHPSIGAPSPAWVQLGEVLIVGDTYLVIDLTDEELAEARGLGLETTVVDNAAGRSPADLAELRIQRNPESALATTDPEVLPEVRPEVFEAVPVEVLVAQPDQTLAAIPDEFWIDAPQSTIDAVGTSRLDQINPNLPRFESGLAVTEKLAPSAELDSRTTVPATTRTTTPTPRTTTPTTTAPEAQDLSDG